MGQNWLSSVGHESGLWLKMIAGKKQTGGKHPCGLLFFAHPIAELDDERYYRL